MKSSSDLHTTMVKDNYQQKKIFEFRRKVNFKRPNLKIEILIIYVTVLL